MKAYQLIQTLAAVTRYNAEGEVYIQIGKDRVKLDSVQDLIIEKDNMIVVLLHVPRQES